MTAQPADGDGYRVFRLSPSTRETVAHHEAGHTIAAVLWVGNLTGVTIVPTPGVSLGRVTLRHAGNSIESYRQLVAGSRDLAVVQHTRAQALGRARFSLAGWAAEGIYRRKPLMGLSRWFDEPDVDEARALVAAVYPGARDMLVKIIMDREYRRARAIVREHWGHVTAIATALVKRETLTADEVYEILDVLPWMRRPRYRAD